MTAQIDMKASLNLKGFEALRKGLSAGQYVKVGVFGDHKTNRTSGAITNPELAVIHEFGSLSARIPARSFLRMPVQEKRADILKFGASKKVADLLLAGDKKKALGLIGAFAENVIQSAFDTGGFGKWAKNAYITIHGGWMRNAAGKPIFIKGKKSDKPLIDTSELRKAIWSKVVGVN